MPIYEELLNDNYDKVRIHCLGAIKASTSEK